MKIFSLRLLVFLMSTLTTISGDKQIQCNLNSLIRADANIAKILTLGQSGRRFPENERQTVAYCRDTFKLINSVENYAKTCLQDMSKHVSQVLLYQVKNQVKQLCRRDSKRLQELIKVAPCANKASNQLNKCNAQFIDKLLAIKNVDTKKKIPHICCEYQKIFVCIHENANQTCTESQLEQAATLVRVMTGGVLGSLCNEYREDSDKCNKLGKIPEKTKNQRRSKSFYIPLIDVLKSFDNTDVRSD